MISSLKKHLFLPTNIHSLIFIRIAFGLIMFSEIIKFFDKDLINYFFLEPEFHFKYFGFAWVKVASAPVINFIFIALAILALFIAGGLFYRISTILFLFGFTYIFLLEQAIYLNHYYLIIIFNFLLCFMPANRYFSIDSEYLTPQIKSKTIPSWPIILIKIQVEIILIYAGIVKINSDWLQFYPLKIWFANQGAFFSNTFVIGAASYYAILIHILGAPLLLLKKTRIWVFALYAIFHSINAYIFTVDIGIFPWITLALTTIFFQPNWPVQFADFCKKMNNLKIFSLKEIAKIYKKSVNLKTKINKKHLPKYSENIKNLILILIIIWTAFHIFFPLRKLLYPGNPAWTKQGYYFSWRMKLHHIIGNVSFHIKDNKSEKYLNDYDNYHLKSLPGELHHLTFKQAIGMGCKPYMILQYAHFLKEKYTQKIGHDDLSIYAIGICSLNDRKPAFIIDQNFDLGNEQENFSHPKWILPLDKSLKPGQGGFNKFTVTSK